MVNGKVQCVFLLASVALVLLRVFDGEMGAGEGHDAAIGGATKSKAPQASSSTSMTSGAPVGPWTKASEPPEPLVVLSQGRGGTKGGWRQLYRPYDFTLDAHGGYSWRFTSYEPSAMEMRWAAESQGLLGDGVMCALWRRSFEAQGNQMEEQLSAFAQSPSLPCSDNQSRILWPPQIDFDHSIFSRMKYEFQCVRPPCATTMPQGLPALGAVRYSYIEPLVGLLRHPGTCNETRRFDVIVDKSYLLIDQWPLAEVKAAPTKYQPHMIFVDVGASGWRDLEPWFQKAYLRHWVHDVSPLKMNFCASFTVYAWLNASCCHEREHAWMPGYIKIGYYWDSVPVPTAVDSWRNPNNRLLRAAIPGYMVVYKIDDEVGQELVHQILEYPEIIDVVDELYYNLRIEVESIPAST